MRKYGQTILIVVLTIMLSAPCFGADKGVYSVKPTTHQGKKWRIGYLEGGPYHMYPAFLKGIVMSLADLGWLEKPDMPEAKDREDSSELWKWLAVNVKSEYIEFVADAHWSAKWEDATRKSIKESLIKRLKQKKDIDLMMALGTWGGQDLANNDHSTPTMVTATSNPLQAGIIKSIEDSGYDHVHARIAPMRFERQVRLFHDIIGFQKLGIAYENTEAGKTYAALTDVQTVAKDRGFEIVSCYTKDDVPEATEADASVVKCCQELADKADAIYLTVQRGVNLGNMKNLLKPLNEKHIPTFSMGGSDEVKHGALLSIAQANYKYVGKFHAEVMAKIFNGAKPRDLDQVFEDPPKIAINLATAELIGYDPPFDILAVADELYQEIAEPPAK